MIFKVMKMHGILISFSSKRDLLLSLETTF